MLRVEYVHDTIIMLIASLIISKLVHLAFILDLKAPSLEHHPPCIHRTWRDLEDRLQAIASLFRITGIGLNNLYNVRAQKT